MTVKDIINAMPDAELRIATVQFVEAAAMTLKECEQIGGSLSDGGVALKSAVKAFQPSLLDVARDMLTKSGYVKFDGSLLPPIEGDVYLYRKIACSEHWRLGDGT